MKKNLIKSILLVITCASLCGCSVADANTVIGNYYKVGEPASQCAEKDSYEMEEKTATSSNVIKIEKINKPIEKAPYKFEIGEVVEGFKVVSIDEVERWKSVNYGFEHVKTGAKLIYVDNDDINRSFQIAMRTPVDDEKGLPHVFEHATVSGSEKYPSGNLVYEMMDQSYMTFVSAFTDQLFTFYPIASLSEDQLFASMDFYLDSVFNPLIMTDENIMRREAYRYDLPDKDSDISILGSVYSEMCGLQTVDDMGYRKNLKTLMPNGAGSVEMGGIPKDIVKLTHQEIKDFHDKYYVPSNSLTLLYGKLDVQPFLKHINEEYFDKYEAVEIDYPSIDGDYWEGSVVNMVEVPVSSESSAQPSAKISFGSDKLSDYDELNLKMIMDTMLKKGSPFYDYIYGRFPNIDISIETELGSCDCSSIMLDIYGFEAKDFSLLKRTIDEAISYQAAKGLNHEVLRSNVEEVYLVSMLNENGNFAIDYSNSILYGWAVSGDANAYLGREQAIMDLTKNLEGSYFDDLFNRYFLNIYKSVATIAIPKYGQLEINDQAMTDELEAMKNSMSDEEVEALVNSTQEFNKWVEANSDIYMLDKVKTVSCKDLPIEVKEYKRSVATEDGIKYVSSKVDNNEVIKTELYFDSSAVPYENLHAMNLFAELLGEIPTSKHSVEEIKQLIKMYLPNLSVRVTCFDQRDDMIHPYFVISFYTTEDELDDSYALLQELLYEQDYSNQDIIKEYAYVKAANIANVLSKDPDAALEAIAFSMLDRPDAYHEYTTGMMGYMQYLREVYKMSSEELAAVITDIDSMGELIFNKNRSTVISIGNDENNALNILKAKEFTKLFSDEEYASADYNAYFPFEKKNMAIVGNVPSAYVIEACKIPEDVTDKTKLELVAKIAEGGYIFPVTRYNMGIYSAWCNAYSRTMDIQAYNSPVIKECFDVYAGVDDYLKDTDFTEEGIEGFKLKRFSSYAATSGDYSEASRQAVCELTGIDYAKDRADKLATIKDFTVDDIKDYVGVYERFGEDSVKLAIGSKQEIERASEYFDIVTTDF